MAATTEHHWADLYTYACGAFGQTPRAQDEQQVIDAFERSPLLVRRQIDEIAEAVTAGRIKWGWSALAARVQQQPTRDATVTTGDTRELAITKAEAWIRNAGLHFDRETEVEDALFGDLGPLRDWANDNTLRHRLLRDWRDQRPRGERSEADELDRAEHWRAIHKPPIPTGRGGERA